MPGRAAPKVNGANHDESDKSAHAAAAKAAWIEPQASLQRSFSDDPFADGGWYDEVMSASSAASRQTTQNNDYQPPKSPAARLVARSAAEFAGWAGTAFTVLAGRLIEMSDAAAGSSDAAAPGLRTANPADPDRLSSRLGSRSSP